PREQGRDGADAGGPTRHQDVPAMPRRRRRRFARRLFLYAAADAGRKARRIASGPDSFTASGRHASPRADGWQNAIGLYFPRCMARMGFVGGVALVFMAGRGPVQLEAGGLKNLQISAAPTACLDLSASQRKGLMKYSNLIALVFSLTVSLAPPVRAGEREQAIAAIEKLGGKIEFAEDEPGRPARLIYLQGKRVADKELALLKALPDLKRLDLRDAKVTDEGLRLLGKMPQLEALYLWNTLISDDGLVHLKALKKLHLLNLSGTKITDKGLIHIGQMPRLDMLRLDRTQV